MPKSSIQHEWLKTATLQHTIISKTFPKILPSWLWNRQTVKSLFFLLLFKYFYLSLPRSYADVPVFGTVGVGIRIRKGVYQALCSLALQNFATSKSSQEHGNGRCPVGMFYTYPLYVHTVMEMKRVYKFISAWASALSVQLDWAMRRPL